MTRNVGSGGPVVPIRPVRDGELPRLAALVAGLLPSMVITERGLEHMRLSTSWWVAEQEGELVGAARAGRFGRLWVGVSLPARRRGIGSALLAHVEAVVRVAGWLQAVAWTDDDEGAHFATRHGYREVRRKHVSVLDLDEARLPPLVVPRDVELLPLVMLADRLHELHELAMAAHRDDPGDGLDSQQSFEEWLRDDLGVPDLDLAGSAVAAIAGELTALALIATNGAERAEHEFTGTHPDFRGRGLATLTKLWTLHWARERGIREVWAGNDTKNVAMLAINRRLGYRPVGLRRQYARVL